MIVYMKVIGMKKEKDMVLEHTNGKMDQFISAIGKTMLHLVMVN